MFLPKSPGAGLFRLSLTGAVCLSLAASSWAQDTRSERIPVQPNVVQAQTPDKTPTAPVADETKAEGHGGIGTPGFTPVTGDEPDFAPMEEVFPVEGKSDVSVVVPKGNPYVLSFVGGDYTPERGIDPKLMKLRKANPEGYTYGYVMLRGRMADEKKVAVLKKLGIEILAAHTYQSYEAKIPLATLPQIGALPFVQWVGYALPDQKLEPQLLKNLETLPLTQRYEIDVSVFASDIGPETARKKVGATSADGMVVTGQIELVSSNGKMQKGLEELGYVHRHYNEVGKVHIFEGWATGAQILQMRDLDFVSFIELKQVHVASHDQSVGMISQDRVRGAYTGSPITLGVIDTGMSNSAGGSPFVTHKDLAKYAIGWSTVTGQGVYADGHGHGTHVAGTMIGTGTQDRRYKGNAPGVGSSGTTRFFVGRYLNDAGNGSGSVSTLYSNFKNNYTSGSQTSLRPRAVNNSWGAAPSTTQYIGSESGARTLDGYIYSYDQTYCFASGNKGVGCNSPGTAKNALTVGSVDDYWSGTIKPGDLSSFSKSGTKDGRRKPEVLAPGSTVTSCLTKSTTGYTNKSGTSMATPHVTGMIASLVQHYSSYFNYSPCQIKAHAMASATWQGSGGASSGYFGASGFGIIDTYKMHYGSTRSAWWTYRGASTALNASGKYWYATITIPSTITHAKLVMSFVEQACGSGASKARVCDVRVYVDIAPFTAGGNTGEYVLSSSALTNLSKSGTSFANAIKGKQVRFKVYAQSIPSGYAPKAGFTLLYHYKSQSVNPSLTAYASPSKVKPSDQFTWYATLAANANGSEFSNARIFPNFPSYFPIQYLYRYTADSVLQQYLPSSPYTSNPYPSLSYTTLGGMTVGSGTSRDLRWRLKAPTTSGTYTLYSYAWADYLSLTQLSASNTVCVDGLAPKAISGLTSATHPAGTWRNTGSFTAKWLTAADNGCAGIGALAYTTSTSSTTTPTSYSLSASTVSKSLTLGSTSGLYFHLRSRDAVLNYGPVAHYGPIRVDLTKPTLSKVHINSNATYTTSLNVTVAITAADTYSGAAYMRYSSNNSTWSPWTTYSTAAKSYNLSSYGGNTAQGTKYVYVQVRDLAGNISSTYSDSIVYDSVPPVISTVVLNGGATWTTSSTVAVVATGSGANYMQYSFNGTTWSGLYTYTTSARNFSVGSFGGSTSQGTKTCYVRLRDVAGNYSTVKADSIIYDSVAPVVTTTVINAGATYTNSTTVAVQVLGTGSPTQVQYSFNNSTWSSWMSYTTGTRNLSVASYGGNSNQGTKTCYARLRDGAGNVSTTKADSIIYDSTAPVVTTVSINGGATYTSSTTVAVQVLGSGSPTQVQYSFNGSTWSSWMSYTTGTRNLSVASYGGNSNTGTKTVYARLRDGATNVSAVKTDSIIYLKIPTFTTISGNTFEVIHDAKITLNGSGFQNVNRAYVGTTLITSQNPEDWHAGFFRIISDSLMEVYPPQNLAPNTYVCYVRNSAYKSANFNSKVVYNTTSKTAVPVQLQSGKVLHVYTARGPKPATTVSVLTFSLSSKPLVIPGLISLGHGGNIATFIDPSFTIISPGQLHNATTRTAHWAFPTPAGKIAGVIYWQSVMFDAAKPTQTPIPVSTTDFVKFYK